MAKRTIDFGDYSPPSYEEYTGDPPPANQWFTGQVTKVVYKGGDDDALMFVVELVDNPDYAGWGKAWFAPFDGSQKWKLQEMIRALQGGAEKPVSLDWENDTQVAAFLKKCKRIKFKTENYNDDIKIRKVGPLLEVAGAKPTTARATTAVAAAPAPEPESQEDEALEDYTEEELDGMKLAELKEILEKEFEVDVPNKGRRESEEAYKDKLIDAILDAQDEDGGSDASEGDGDADTDDAEFEDGFEDTAPEPEPEPEPEPAPAPRTRRRAAAPAAAPEPEAAPARATRRRR